MKRHKRKVYSMEQQTKPVQGYKKRPLIITIINIAYFLAPFYYYWYVAVKHRLSPLALGAVLGQFDGYTVVLCVSALVVAVGLYVFNQVGWYLFLAHSVFIFTANIAALINLKQSSALLSILFQVITVAVAVYFIIIHKRFRAIYFNPRLRWWKAASRYLVEIEGELCFEDGARREVTIKDISRRGAGVQFQSEEGLENLAAARTLSFSFENNRFTLPVRFIWQNLAKKFTGFKFQAGIGQRIRLLFVMRQLNKRELKNPDR